MVIVTHNSEMVIDTCLDALAEMAPRASVTVIDNASRDRTVERVRPRAGVQVIANTENLGFAAAVNQGVQRSPAAAFLLLNPDTRLLTPLDALAEAARVHGLAAGKLVDPSGKPQRGFTIRRFPTPAALIFELFGINRLWPSNPVNRRYRYLDRDLDKPGPVEQPAGAFLMFRKDVWDRLGGLDEQFHPVWFEDVDFCGRAQREGFQIEYVPEVAAEHAGGHSVRGISEGCRTLYWCDSLLKYASKHFRFLAFKGICLAVVLSSVPRAVAGMIRSRRISPIFSGFRVAGLAGMRLILPRPKLASRPAILKRDS